MISIDVRQVALNLVSAKKHEQGLLISIAQRMTEAAVDIVNTPEETDEILEHLVSVYEGQYDLIAPDDAIMHIVGRLRTYMDNLGWDRRLKVKVGFKTIDTVLCVGMVRMDLDSTFVERERTLRRDKKRKTAPVEVVNDNPSSEEINEFFTGVDRETARKTHLRAVKSSRRA